MIASELTVSSRLSGSLISLANLHPMHLAAFISENGSVFLNPEMVGDLRRPTLEQFEHFVMIKFGREATDDEALYDAIAHALLTGSVEGPAKGDESDDESDDEENRGDFLEEVWRDHPSDGWAAALVSMARSGSQPLSVRLALRTGGTEQVQAWLISHLPQAVRCLKEFYESVDGEEKVVGAARAIGGIADSVSALLGTTKLPTSAPRQQENLPTTEPTTGELEGTHQHASSGKLARWTRGDPAVVAKLQLLFPQLLLLSHFVGDLEDGVGIAAQAQERLHRTDPTRLTSGLPSLTRTN